MLLLKLIGTNDERIKYYLIAFIIIYFKKQIVLIYDIKNLKYCIWVTWLINYDFNLRETVVHTHLGHLGRNWFQNINIIFSFGT